MVNIDLQAGSEPARVESRLMLFQKSVVKNLRFTWKEALSNEHWDLAGWYSVVWGVFYDSTTHISTCSVESHLVKDTSKVSDLVLQVALEVDEVKHQIQKI